MVVKNTCTTIQGVLTGSLENMYHNTKDVDW